MKAPLEKDIQSSILEYLRLRKILCWKTGSGAFRIGDRFIRMGQAGVSDIVGCLPSGIFFAIEVKRPGTKPTDEQAKFIDDVNRNKGKAFVARSIEDVQQQGI